jgi:hypothetical protein
MSSVPIVEIDRDSGPIAIPLHEHQFELADVLSRGTAFCSWELIVVYCKRCGHFIEHETTKRYR